MEKEGLFYKRSSLTAINIIDLIRLWEINAGESFYDNFNNNYLGESFMGFLKVRYSHLYEYCFEQELHDLEDLIKSCNDYYTEDVYNDFNFWDKAYELSLYPIADYFLTVDKAWDAFVEFFTEPNNTCSGTPWIDSYNIRKDFENEK